jgi:hypothetical protein
MCNCPRLTNNSAQRGDRDYNEVDRCDRLVPTAPGHGECYQTGTETTTIITRIPSAGEKQHVDSHCFMVEDNTGAFSIIILDFKNR